MKKILVLIFLYLCNNICSQELTKTQINQLDMLTIKIEKFNLDDSKIQETLSQILILDKKRKTNKTIAITLSSIAISGLILGSTLYTKGDGISELFGDIIVRSGVVYGAISIPFWVATDKRRKERDELKKIFDEF